MKKIQAIRLRVTIFILLILLAFALVVPAHNKLVKIGDNLIAGISKQIEEKTGLVLSYSSFSPSILSVFSIQDINLSQKDGTTILSISKTKINYNILDLFKANIQRGINNITIDGITLDVTKLIELVNTYVTNQKQNEFDYKTLKTKIPGNIKLKNISLKYENEKLNAELLLKDIGLVNNEKKENLTFNLDSLVYLNLFNPKEHFSSSVTLHGTIPDNLENSLVYLNVSNFTDGNYKLNKLNLMASYSKNVIDIQTIQAVNPVFVSASYDIQSGKINASVKSDKLSPVSMFSSNQKNLKKFSNLLIDTNTSFFCDVNTKQIDYASDGAVFVPDSVFKGGAQVRYSLEGDEKGVVLEDLSLEGENCQADVNLSCIFNTLQVSGFAELPYFILPNGNMISTELYFDPLDKGFMIFSPQVFLGDKALTALQFSLLPQKDSYDFVFEAYDYSHAGSADAGIFKLDGSFLDNYVQSAVSVNSFYVDSIIDFALQFMGSEQVQKIETVKSKVSDFMFSGDVYVSTDFKSLSYNVPYILLANTKKDNQFLMMALNGNEQSIQLNQLSLILGKYALDASASLDKNPETQDMFFVIDANSSSVPYHFSGTIMPEVINVTGDYGADFEIRFGEKKDFTGHAYFKEFPVSYDGKSVVFSTESDFSYDLENGPSVVIKSLDMEAASSTSSVSPKLLMSGNVTKYGAQLDSIAYTDFYSALEGTADVMVNVNNGIFDSVGLLMNVKNPLSDEAIVMDATVSNPERLQLNSDTLMESLYINSQILINNFSLNRFAELKNDNNLLSASLFASGTINHPYVALSLDELTVLLAGNFLKTHGSITLEDKLLSINDFKGEYQTVKIDELSAMFSLDNFEGFATSTINTEVNGKNMHIPLELSIGNTSMKSGKFLPESTMVTLSAPQIDGSFVKKPFGFDITAMVSNSGVTLFSSDNLGLYGTVDTDGTISASVNSTNAYSFTVSGKAGRQTTDIKFGNMNVDLKKVFSYFDLDDSILVDGGILTGNFSILQSFNDPILKGALLIENPMARLPTLIQQEISTSKTLITIINNEIRVNETEYFAKGSNSAFVGAVVYMNKWNVDHTEATIRTTQRGPVYVKLITPAMSIAGDVNCNLKMYVENKNMTVTGKLAAENVNITSDISSISSPDAFVNPKGQTVRTDMDIVLGNHAAVTFDPLLRCVFVPNTHMNLKMDQEENLYEIDGELKIKSGDIAYLNRSFYIKEGNIKFNKTEFNNPQITITAETRERDDKGENVRIILSAENQYLMNFNPKFSSVPAKSENEIAMLLGQIVVADSDTAANFLFAAGDYAIQSAVVRKAENKLREVLNFDIFSLRTNVLQNTLNLGVTGNLSKDTLSIGNFLDNSTVYVGKYLGSSLYLDAMLHVSFQDTFARDITSGGTLLFQPEFGLEMESPYGNIRWNMAPDINALLNNQFVPSTSVTLSWKFTF